MPMLHQISYHSIQIKKLSQKMWIKVFQLFFFSVILFMFGTVELLIHIVYMPNSWFSFINWNIVVYKQKHLIWNFPWFICFVFWTPPQCWMLARIVVHCGADVRIRYSGCRILTVNLSQSSYDRVRITFCAVFETIQIQATYCYNWLNRKLIESYRMFQAFSFVLHFDSSRPWQLIFFKSKFLYLWLWLWALMDLALLKAPDFWLFYSIKISCSIELKLRNLDKIFSTKR